MHPARYNRNLAFDFWQWQTASLMPPELIRCACDFAGSMLEALVTSAVIDPSANHGVGGDTTAGVLNRLSLCQSMNEAKTVVLAVGVNDLKPGVAHGETLANSRAILNSTPPSTPVLVGAPHPVDETVIKYRIANKETVRLNAELAKLTEKHENTEFVDSSALSTDSDGRLVMVG